MAGVNVKSWEGLFILSVLVPAGLLAGFKLTGIIGGPVSITETLRLETAVWNRERPFKDDLIPGCPMFNTSYAGNDVNLTVGHWFAKFEEDSGLGVSILHGGIATLNASVPKGFIVSVEVVFKEAYQPSFATYFQVKGFWAYVNLTLSEFDYGSRWFRNPALSGQDKLRVKTVPVGQPCEVYLEDLDVEYCVNSPYNQTHQIMIESTVTYFNGTVYKQLVQPLELVFGPDHDNSFEEAEEIGFGIHQDYVDEDVTGDPVDYFKIWLLSGQTVNVSVLLQDPRVKDNDLPLYAGLLWPDVFVYNPERNLEAYLFAGEYGVNGSGTWPNVTSHTLLTVNQTGWWCMKVTSTLAPSFLYALNVTLVAD